MPAVKTTNLLAQVLGEKAREALDKHKSKPPELKGFDELPEMNGAIAQLDSIGFEKIEKGQSNNDQDLGKLRFKGSGVIKSPDFVKTPQGDQKVAGRRTFLPSITIKDQKDASGKVTKTWQENLWLCQDYVKMLWPGLPESELTLDTLAETCVKLSNLKDKRPHFRFRVWKGSETAIVKLDNGFCLVGIGRDGQPNTSEILAGPCKTEFDLKKKDRRAAFAGRKARATSEWQQWVEWKKPDPAGNVVDEHANGQVAREEPAEAAAEGEGEVEVEETQGEPEDQPADASEPSAFDADGAIQEMCKLADLPNGEDDAARDKAREDLGRVAIGAGMSEEEWANFDITVKKDGSANYEAALLPRLAELSGGAAAEQPEPAAEESAAPWKPTKGGVCVYNRRKPLAPVEVVVLTVDAKARTATLKNNTTNMQILGADKTTAKVVSWDDLVEK